MKLATKLKQTGLATFSAAAVSVFVVSTAFAAAMVVTPGNTQGWTDAQSTAGGQVSFQADSNTPLGTGAIQLTTDATNAAKANYVKPLVEPVALSSVNGMSYWTKQVSGPPHASASYQLAVDLDANGTFDTNLVYEPYIQAMQDPASQQVMPNVWQEWNAQTGLFWSSKTAGSLNAGAGGPPYYTIAQVLAAHPNAKVMAFGVNVGSYNPNHVIRVDGVVFNGDTYNFEAVEPTPVPVVATNKEQCKNGGWKTLVTADGKSFKNQGQCVSYVQPGSKSKLAEE